MKKSLILTQRKTALILMGLGVFLVLFIFIFFYIKIVRVPGFPEILPTDQTIAYGEFPLRLGEKDPLRIAINQALKIDLDKEISPWASQRAAIAFLKSSTEGKIMPFVLIQVRSTDQALAYLKGFGNPAHALSQDSIDGIRTFSTPAITFAFLSGIVVISPSSENLTAFIHSQTGIGNSLSGESNFRRIYKNSSNDFFLYLKPNDVPIQAYNLISKSLPQLPLRVPIIESLGIGGKDSEDLFKGSAYGIFTGTPPQKRISEGSYKATILPLLPDEFSFLVAGRNPLEQIEEMGAFFPSKSPFLNPAEILHRVVTDYFPGVDFDSIIAPILRGEFAVSVKGENVLFISDISGIPSIEKNVAAMRAAFQSIAGRFTPELRKVTLPDGTVAAELIPDPSQISPYEERYEEIQIHGVLMGKNLAIYDALVDDNLFISNNLELLKKSLSLTRAQGPNIRDSGYYKKYLQPILKNPELLGVSILPSGIFSFSKQTSGTSMETNFIYGSL